MANRYISGTSTTPTWTLATGGTVQSWDNYSSLGYPTPNDVVFASGKTITIDSGITVSLLSTAVYPGGLVGGGGFVISINTGLTITTNISAGTTTCLTTSHNDGTITIIGNISGGTVANAHGVTHSGLGRLSISGNVTGGNVANVLGVSITNTGGISLSACPSVYVTGNTYGGTHITTTPAIFSSSLCLVDIYGDCIAGNQFSSVYLSNQSALLIVRGNLISSSGISPYYGYNIKCDPNTIQNYTFQDTSVSSANTIFSTSAYTYGMPATSDVRIGVKYGYLSGLTGTMVIPPFSAVSVGLPVDDGTGTGVLNYGTAITSIRDIGNMLGGFIG